MKNIKELTSSNKFQSMQVFKKIKLLSRLERNKFENTYSPVDRIKQNLKQDASNIVGADTVRGCKNNCIACYANKLCAQARVNHSIPVNCSLEGKLKPGKILRIGIVGDPATDWKHTCEEIRQLLARSRGAKKEDIVFVTKLQKTRGLDLDLIKNMQVSVDPLNPQHMEKTFSNIRKITKAKKGTRIILRIRSYDSKNVWLTGFLNKAVEFANKEGLPVLETRMRMPKDYCVALGFNLDNYHQHGSNMKANHGFLHDQIKTQYFLCDKNNSGCKNCNNCYLSLLDKDKIKE